MMRTIGWIVCSLVVVAGIGLYFGWFTLSTSKGSTDKGSTEKDKTSTDKENTDAPNLNLTINKDKFKEDMTAVKEKFTGKSIEGQIRRIETSRQEFTIFGKETQEVTVKVDGYTKIKFGAKEGSFGELKVDDRVSVNYEATKSGNVAKTIAVSNRAIADSQN